MVLTLVLLSIVFCVHQARSARPLHRSLWACIHRGEGSWTDAGAPYWGGLQLGWWFMSTYGSDLLRRKGTADRWTPAEQMLVAERGYARSGYSTSWVHGQWPVSSRRCI